jgi:PAS domain S-box-containing protein
MKEKNPSPFQALWGKPAPKIDIEHLAQALIDLLLEPALLVDLGRGKNIYANSPFLLLSAYSLAEITGLSLVDLFEPFDLAVLSGGEATRLMLKLRNRPALPVVVRPTQVEPVNQWVVMRITPLAVEKRASPQWQEMMLNFMKSLPGMIRDQDLDATLQKMIAIPRDLFDTNLVCIYHARSDAPELHKVCTQEKIAVFPEDVPAVDLIRLSTSTVWTPGKRVNTELHRAGRIGNLSYVATTPLGEAKAVDGLLVVGGIDAQPPEMLIGIIELLGTFISLAYEHRIRQENLALEKSNYELNIASHQVMYEYVQDGILILDSNLTVSAINPAAEWMLGYTDHEIAGQPVENILITPDRLPAVLASAVEGISTPNLESITLHRRDGQTFSADLKVISYPINDHKNGVVVIFRDISEHEQIRTQTRQLEQRALLGEFMGVFAHEVLNPINSISMGAQVLASRFGADDPNYDLIMRIENDCQRLSHQMEALKSYAKPYEPSQEPVDLGGLLIRIIERWRPRMSRVNVSPIYQIPENLPRVIGDWRALEQVFTNLISNAIDAMSQNGGILSVKVDVSTDTANRRQVEIGVSDNGPGIPDEIRGRIFEPFVTTKSSGTGLGLAITKRIVTAHRGVITVNSFPGGTVFTVYLPACEDEE